MPYSARPSLGSLAGVALDDFVLLKQNFGTSAAADTAAAGTLADRVDLVDPLQQREIQMPHAGLPAMPRILRCKVKHPDIDYGRYRRG